MSHTIHIKSYDENEDKAYIQKHWDNVAAVEGAGEGSTGLGSKIRWIDSPIYKSYEEADKAISRLDRGHYDQLAVKFYDSDQSVKWLVKVEYHT